jgi:hypothetical protein
MQHRQPPARRASRHECVTGIARTERVCIGPGAANWLAVHVSPGINPREPPRPAITCQLAASARVRILLRARHGLHAFPSPSVGIARKEEGENHSAFNRVGTRPPARWSNARKARHRPAAKTSNPRLPPDDVKHAVVPSRRDENPGRRASSPPTLLRSGRLHARNPKKSLLRRPFGPSGTSAAPPTRRARLRSHQRCRPGRGPRGATV